MGAFSTVLLAIVLIFAAGRIKLVIALMRKNPAAAKERVPFMPALYPACPCLSLLRRESETSAATCSAEFSYYAANRHKRKISCTVR